MNRLIANLLDVSRLEARAMKLTRQPADVQDLIGTALEQLGERTRSNPVSVNVAEGLPFVHVDFSLIVQALVNVLDNALKYSPPGLPIDVTAARAGREVSIAVADRGPGIPAQDLAHVFDKFYRVQRPDMVSGTGLGLSICRGIVETHGGHVSAENRIGGGTVIRLSLLVEPDKEPHV